MSRLQPVLVPTPERQHYPVIVQQVVRDVASDWGLPVEVMPALEVSGLARAAGSVRELVRLVRREIVREVSVSGSLGLARVELFDDTPTVDDLLTMPPTARPERTDEIQARNQIGRAHV